MNKNRLVTYGVLAAALLVVGFGFHWIVFGRYVETTDNAYVEADSSVVSPEIEGYVELVRVADHEAVKQGDPLVVVDERSYRAKLEQAESAVASAQASVTAAEAAIANLDAQYTQQKNLVSQASAGLDSANADLQRAKLDFARYKSLAGSAWVSRQRFETADADNRKAAAAVERAAAALESETNKLPVIESAKREAVANAARTRADLAQAQAARDLAQLNVEKTIIRAPIDGVVGNRLVQVGQYVRPGTQLLTVVPLPQVYVTANFKETQLAGMRVGQPVEIRIDAYPGETLDGEIESFAPGTGSKFSLLPTENATGNFTKIVQRVPVRIRLVSPPDARPAIMPGLSAVVSVDTKHPGTATGTARAKARSSMASAGPGQN
jgi:membrane fusion protein (multidrug efflux system)